jgi:hypothetical protein
MSSPEVTVLHLMTTPSRRGGLSNIATVVGELLDGDNRDIPALARESLGDQSCGCAQCSAISRTASSRVSPAISSLVMCSTCTS